MNFRIVEDDDLSGAKCKFYTVELEDGTNLFDEFVENQEEEFSDELDGIFRKIESMAKTFGAREDFFKLNYGEPGDGVCALFDEEDRKLRLMCIRYPNVAVILGDGGPKEVRAIQDDPSLDESREKMIFISAAITKRIREGEIQWSKDGTELLGDLIFKFD